MSFNKHFKKLLNILLLVLIFVSLVCYCFVQRCKLPLNIVENYGPRPGPVKRQRRVAPPRLPRKFNIFLINKKYQDYVKTRIPPDYFNNIKKCSVDTNNPIQISEKSDILSIFGADRILTNGFVFEPAMKSRNPPGIMFQKKNNSDSIIKYGNEVIINGTTWKIKDLNSGSDVKYGDEIIMQSLDESKKIIIGTVNPDIYNVNSLKITDCFNNTDAGVISV